MTQKTKRILHVTSGLGVGGAETMLFRLVRSLHGHNGYEHTIITLTDTCGFDFVTHGVSVDVVDFRKLAKPVSNIVRLWQTIRMHKPDVIQSWMYHGNVAATLLGPAEVPVVWGIHHSLHDLLNEKLATRLLIRSGAFLGRWKNTSRIIYVSEKSREHHCAHGYPMEKSVVIPNGFDCLDFSPDESLKVSARRELGLDDSHVLIGNFGRYHPVKDHGLLLRAFAAVTKDFPAARLLLVGAGITEENKELVNMIRMFGISGRVVLLGLRNDMPRLYNALDLYVLSSKSESFPNVLGEASACGVVSITTDVGDAGQLVGEAGIVVPSSSIDALAQALRKMLSLERRERQALGERARQNIVNRFGLPSVVGAYSGLYEELTSRP